MKRSAILRRKAFPLILICSIVFILGGLTVPIAAVKPPSQVVFWVEPEVTSGVAAGENVTVDVYIDAPAGSAIVGWTIDVKVDPNVLQPWFHSPFPPPFGSDIWATGGGNGYFLYDWCFGPPVRWGDGTEFLQGGLNKSTGTITGIVEGLVSWKDLTPGDGASGTGKLATLHFTSKNETAYSPIEITDALYFTSLDNPSDIPDTKTPDVIIDGHYNAPTWDVAVTSVSAPTNATVGDIVDINVNVTNLGDSTGLNLTLTYDSTIIETRLMSLASATSKTELFSWNTTDVAPWGDYTIKAEAVRPGDFNLTNNFKTTTITILTHDVAVTNISAPTTAIVGELVSINVTVANQGSFDENVNLTVSYDSTLINTTDISVLPVGGNETVEFSWNTAGLSSGTYTINATATIALDKFPGDNTDTKQIELYATHDVAVTNISAPTTAIVGELVSINVTVANQGNYTESVTVTVYNDTTEIGTGSFTLTRGASETVEFSWNTAGLSSGTYTINATATIAQDDDLSDNFKTTTIELKIHDVAVTSVTTSTNTAKIGETVSINVTVVNEGTEKETSIKVTVDYNDTIIETQTITELDPDASQTLTFSWDTSNVTAGTYTIKAVATPVPGETDTDDNTSYGAVTVEKAAAVDILIYVAAAGAAAIIIAAAAIYFLKIRKPKPP